MESLKSLGLPNKFSKCEVNALRVNKTVQRGINLPANKPPNKFTCHSGLQRHYLNYSFNIAAVSKSVILTIFKNVKVSKAASLDNLSGYLVVF